MAFDVKLPDIGEGVAEGEIVRWLVKVGDPIKEDQPMVEVMTDKANVEIPAPRTGTIAALHFAEGTVVPVGSVIVSIDVAGGAAATTAPAATTHAAPSLTPAPPRAAAGAAPSSATAAVHATPAVRALAKQLGVALEAVTATGPGGRITNEDVQGAADGAGKAPAPSTPAKPAANTGPEERIPLRGLRRKIAEHMRHSLDTAAHFTFVAECDMSAVVQHLAGVKSRAKQAGIALTYLAYVIKAMVEPLRKYPLINASLDDATGEVVLKKYYNVGIATATADGLTVPVVTHVDTRTLLDVGAEIQRLAAAARAGQLKLEELHGGTITVTSTGARGGLLATPILHHPQVAILGVHEVKKRPVVVNDQIVAREMTNLSLSLDHRVVDGAVGADFLYAVIARLEQPAGWLADANIG